VTEPAQVNRSDPRHYDERWVPPFWVWAATLSMALVIALTLHSGGDGARAVVPYVVVLPLTVLGLALSSRGRVRVENGALIVPGARIDLNQLGGVRPLDREDTRRLRGPLAQPRAFVTTRPWLTTAVQVQLEDPDDDTPYWLVGTRDPQALVEALTTR